MFDNPFMWLLLASGIAFLFTAGQLIASAATVAALFGKSRRAAQDGEIVRDPLHPAGPERLARARRTLAIHLVSLALLVLSGLALSGMIFADRPAGPDTPPGEIPVETDPIP